MKTSIPSTCQSNYVYHPISYLNFSYKVPHPCKHSLTSMYLCLCRDYLHPSLYPLKYVCMFSKIYFSFPMDNKLVTMLSCDVRGLHDNLKQKTTGILCGLVVGCSSGKREVSGSNPTGGDSLFCQQHVWKNI